ncbi:ABC transporter ATP-binding protein [Variovorax sp. J22G73]|uniref:dipeptide ABC transporter ATP-binding protein n=1 Tax=unclassified Variovorax TaxID=663243 RepID=UPI00257652E1|nr:MULTISPECIES: ABC transporter ATP-binding protein [unclassified Variovorax]MDM0005802.1 ABC transporter ATP-binding protein [Variovorax sp. J22R203]MDM0099829.1 ABC transporter ATP-binding protein [Variovorax sp. J22G73]
MSLLSIENLDIEFTTGGRTEPAVKGVSLSIAPGDIVALVGESGSGKSVTAAAVLGLLPSRIARARGRIVFDGRDLLGLSEPQLNAVRGQGIGIVFQNSLTSLDPSFRVGDQLLECARHRRKLKPVQARELVATWLERVGIGDAARVMRSYPHELSGGMRQRVMIAIAAMANPRLLIADEPTTALDATIQKQILALLKDINQRYGTAILLITHDFGVVSYLSHRVAVMRAGQIVEQGATQQVLRAPAHAYTRQLIHAVPEIGERLANPSPSRRLGVEAKAGTTATGAVPPANDKEIAPVLLEVSDLSKTFVIDQSLFDRRGKAVHAVQDVSMQVRRGEIFGLIGESGSGKSTLARLVAQLLPATSGTVRFGGLDTQGLEGEALTAFRRRLQFVFQDSSASLNPRRSIASQLMDPALRLGVAQDRGEARQLAVEALERVGLPARYLERYPHEFSGGQRQRIGIARALIVKPEFVILDEPTSALDVSIQAQILNLLLDLRQQLDLTYLFIGHNLPVIEFLCDRVAVMAQGRVVETFDAGDLYTNAAHPVTRKLLDSVLPVHSARSPSSGHSGHPGQDAALYEALAA